VLIPKAGVTPNSRVKSKHFTFAVLREACAMARPLGVEFQDASYHVRATREFARQIGAQLMGNLYSPSVSHGANKNCVNT
jgi:hypothetical protein